MSHTTWSSSGLTDRIAVVTGAGRGIGAAIAERLSAAGAGVVLVGRVQEALDRTAAALPGKAWTIVADLADPAAPARLLNQALEVVGGVDVLINNAGAGHFGASQDLSPTDVDGVLALNVRAPLLLTGSFAAHMATRGGGSVVSISSALGGLGNTYNSLYSASKGAVEAATRALAAEWGPNGVRINAVRPGVTRSDMAADIVNHEGRRKTYLKHVPLGRVGEPADIADAVLFLASDAADYITGHVLDVDGGWGSTAPSIIATE